MNLQKNDEVILEIDDLGNNGEGIGHVDGYALFVKGALPSEKVRVKIMKVKKSFGFARLMEILEVSPERVEPLCQVARRCGGCQLQHLSYEGQLVYKEKKVKDCLERIGEVRFREKMSPIMGMDKKWYYRNKAQFPVRRGSDGRAVIGFYAERTHSVIPMMDCMIQDQAMKGILEAILEVMNARGILAYNEESHEGLIRHIFIRKGYESDEIMVCFVINGDELGVDDENALVEAVSNVGSVVSVCVNVNKKRTNVIFGPNVKVLWGNGYIEDWIGDVKYQISALSFYQVNPVQTKRLYDVVLEFTELTGEEVVWDMYCGIGTISLFLAKKAKKVYGVEIVLEAIEDARENARINGIENVEFVCGAVEDVNELKFVGEWTKEVDVVVLDPPRKGCDSGVIHTIGEVKPERVVYVSCDPGTLARDVKALGMYGYEVKKVQAVDMFLHTMHVETVVQLSRRKGTPKIEVKMDVQDGDIPELKNPTYKRIQEYVMEKYGVHVHSAYIAEVKRMCGIEMGENYNKSKKEETEVKQCPTDKVKYIKDALSYFKLK